MELKIIDMLPGAGKTKSMCKYLSDNEIRFIYLTPYNEEVEHVRKDVWIHGLTDLQRLALEVGYTEKDFDKSGPSVPDSKFSKTSAALKLIRNEEDVVCTHELFKLLCRTKSFWKLLEGKNYSLVIDEELQLTEDYIFRGCSYSDVNFFLRRSIDLEMPIVTCDVSGKLCWDSRDAAAGAGAFRWLKKDMRTDNLYLDGNEVRWQIPLEKFKVFDVVYLMTYRYEISKFHKLWDGEFSGKATSSYWYFEDDKLIPGKWRIPKERADNIRRRLFIGGKGCYPNDVGKKSHYSYSRAWYDEATDEDIQKVVKKMQYFMKYGAAKRRLDKNKVIWTTFKDFREKFEAADVGEDTFRPKRGDAETFVPLNMKASNKYLDRNVVFYVVDRYMGPRDDEWALSELLQFLFRTSLRLEDSEEKVYVWLPSERMRGLLVKWLEEL